VRAFALCIALTALAAAPQYDVLLRGGLVYDGSGRAPKKADVALRGDRIARIGNLKRARARVEIDVAGLAVAPGFINMLSWASGTLDRDGRAQSDVRQGVTVEVFGEGSSPGPLNARDGGIGFGAAMERLVKRGVSVNVASFVGATTIRVHEIGWENRAPTQAELGRMKALVRRAMREGALGVGSALIYAPGFYAKTEELIELCRAAAPYHGMYISHLRSEGNRLLEALDELVLIARRARVPAEVYHLKAAGKENWPKMDEAIRKIEAARRAGLRITANMYTYTAGSTGLSAAMPPWAQEGGPAEFRRRLLDPGIRARVLKEMRTPSNEWENLLAAAGAEGTLLLGFRNEALRQYTGKTLAEAAKLRGTSPEEAAMELIVEDDSRVSAAYFLMLEENVRKQIRLPWMSFGSDAGAPSAEGEFLKTSTHPRAYGNFARLLGKYVRDERLIPLEEAIHRLTWLPASNLGLRGRGRLARGYYADVVVFDPARIQDRATFEQPHQYSTGVVHVFVNGVQALKDGEHTGVTPGRFVRGRGYRPGR
jgi:N-acyl-D-amino-acid deacylase